VRAVYTTAPADRPALAQALGERSLLVVSLCAAWCGTCTEFREALERIATNRPDVCFVWLDVEDDAELVGDIDVENFPTLGIFKERAPLHFGVSLPLEHVVSRLIDKLYDKLYEQEPKPDGRDQEAQLLSDRLYQIS
jgi:thioredoxin reductase (NADPH)